MCQGQWQGDIKLSAKVNGTKVIAKAKCFKVNAEVKYFKVSTNVKHVRGSAKAKDFILQHFFSFFFLCDVEII